MKWEEIDLRLRKMYNMVGLMFGESLSTEELNETEKEVNGIMENLTKELNLIETVNIKLRNFIKLYSTDYKMEFYYKGQHCCDRENLKSNDWINECYVCSVDMNTDNNGEIEIHIDTY